MVTIMKFKLSLKKPQDLDPLQTPLLASDNPKYADLSDIHKARKYLALYRGQYYRLCRHLGEMPEADVPDDLRRFSKDLVWKLNCPPAFLHANRRPRTCQVMTACPWCHMRQIAAMRDRLVEQYRELTSPHALLVWRRDTPVDGVSFLKTRSGPHYRLRAAMTAQIAYPICTAEKDSDVTWRHVCAHLVPAEEDVLSSFLNSLNQWPPPLVNLREKATIANISEQLGKVAQKDWGTYLSGRNFPAYVEALTHRPGSRLFRATQVKKFN